MNIATAQRPAASDEDRIFVSDAGVIVLDGATSFAPDGLSARDYVDRLGCHLLRRLSSDEELATILSESIELTARELDVRPGCGPSSTVAIVRQRDMFVDVLVLGDSVVSVGAEGDSFSTVRDERLDALKLPESDRYRARLAEGTGFDSEHRSLLRALQRQQRMHRNRPGGYWIAEADPGAAEHAIVKKYPTDATRWAVAATDGFADILPAVGITWAEIAVCDPEGLMGLLERCHRWEDECDPDGAALPRAKRHDDKSVAVVVPAPRRHQASVASM